MPGWQGLLGGEVAALGVSFYRRGPTSILLGGRPIFSACPSAVPAVPGSHPQQQVPELGVPRSRRVGVFPPVRPVPTPDLYRSFPAPQSRCTGAGSPSQRAGDFPALLYGEVRVVGVRLVWLVPIQRLVGEENGVSLSCLPAPGDSLQPGNVQAEAITAQVLGRLVPEPEFLIFVGDDRRSRQVLELDGGAGAGIGQPDVLVPPVRSLYQVPDLLPDLDGWVVLLDLPGEGGWLVSGVQLGTALWRPSPSGL